MAFSVIVTSGLLGFFAAVSAGLLLGLGFIACLAVYSGVGVASALSIFTVRGLWCAAARQFSSDV